MCNFLSAIVMRNGDVLCDPEHTDSHEDLLVMHNIWDTRTQQNKFVRVEFLPPEDSSTTLDLSTWKLQVDQASQPEWFDEDKVKETLLARVQRMIVVDKRPLLLGGCWILADGAQITDAISARIFLMLGSARLKNAMQGTWVDNMVASAEIQVLHETGVVKKMHGNSMVTRSLSSIESLHEGAHVLDMGYHATVNAMYGKAVIGTMRGCSSVADMYTSATVRSMHEFASVARMQGDSSVVSMDGRARIGNMYGHAKVEEMRQEAKVYAMDDATQIVEMFDDSAIPKNAADRVVRDLRGKTP